MKPLSIKAGMYAWGGPGTIRLLQRKYHSPQIDHESFLTLYDLDRVHQAKRVFDLTDAWVTFSWGFADATEQPDYQHIVERLPHFRQNRIRTHAYIQGLNVVTAEFADQDLFCHDPHQRLIPYSRGRSLTCPNNPHFRSLIRRRVERACREDFDGIFIDNIIFGLPPSFVRQELAPFFGCACKYCQRLFKKQYGSTLPTSISSARALREYVQFRCDSVLGLLRELSQVAHQSQKYFGINLYDPVQTTPALFFGYELADIEPLLDYFLIENHCLPSRSGSHNAHLAPLLHHPSRKPVCVVSYDRGIGFEPAYTQTEFDAIASEATALGYAPCYKVSEFTTRGVWHTADLASLEPLHIRHANQPSRAAPLPVRSLSASTLSDRWLASLSDTLLVPLLHAYFENQILNSLGHPMFRTQLRAPRNVEWRKA